MGLDDFHTDINGRGYARRSHARGAEISDAMFSRHAGAVGLTNQRRNLWVPAGVELSHDQRMDAALEALGGGVLATGASGLSLDGVRSAAPEKVELLMASGRHVRPWPGICIHRTTTFEQVRSHHVAGRTVASIPRCFTDDAQHTTLDALCRDISTALRLRKTTLGAIGVEYAQRKRYPGRAKLGTALARLAEEVTHSGDERLARRLLRAAGLTFHREPMTITDKGSGRPLAEIDIAFPDVLLGIEIDGPHHLLPNVAAADRQRDRMLLRVAGWRIERFFWFEVEERGPWFVSEVQRFLAERTAGR